MGLKGILKFFGVRAFEGVVAILLITFMPNLPPNAKFSKSYSVTPALPLEGNLALNERLGEAELWHKGDFVGPEAFAEYNGELYTSLHGGDVVKLTGNHITPVVKFGKPCKGIYQEQICGRPLGLTFDKNGALYVADAYYGIYKVDVKTGKQLQLLSLDQEIRGVKPKLPNSIAVARNGDLYWTDSSTEFSLQNGLFDMIADGSGRLIHYDSKTKQHTVLLENLHFANGVMLSDDESFVLVSETARSRVHRYYLKGPKQQQSDIFVDGLPGLPDNLQTDGHGGFLVPLVVARDDAHPSAFQIFGPFPLVRKFFARVLGLAELGFRIVDQIYPNEYAERGMHFIGHFSSTAILMPARVTVLHVSKDGNILDSLHTVNKKITGISEAFIFKDYLYLGSPFNDYIARVPLAKAGLRHLAARTPPPTQAPPKPTTTTKPPPTTTQAPPTTTQAPPTQAPKVTTPRPTQAPTPKATTVPPTQAPKVTKPPPTQAPKATNPPPTQAPKATNTPPTQAPKVTTQPPRQSPPPKQAPTTTTSAPVKQSPPPQKATVAPKQAPSTTVPPPPKPSPSKESPKETPKQTQTPPPSQQTTAQPKNVPGKDTPKNAK